MTVGAGRSTIALACLVLATGCSGRRQEPFIPAEPVARQVLETALAAWQRGEPQGPVSGTLAPGVQFIDSHLKPGQRLKTFSVLAMAPGDGPRVFTV